jgi:N-acetylglucosaminyl-diphospho-decaprenol L-rhamnosyltransferase
LEAARTFLASEGVDARVTIVDNDSAVEQRNLLEAGCPGGVELLFAESNLGYGAAANLALKGGEAELICVSNADVRPATDALATLAAAARCEPRAGMVGPAFGVDPDPYHAALPSGAVLLGRAFAGSFRRPGVPEPGPGVIAEVGQPSGALFLMRREAWERMKGFDEGFFLWYEDVDLAKRLHDAGYRNLLIGSARADHAGGPSFAKLDTRRKQEIRLESLQRYLTKHHPRLARTLAPPVLALAHRLRAGGTTGP